MTIIYSIHISHIYIGLIHYGMFRIINTRSVSKVVQGFQSFSKINLSFLVYTSYKLYIIYLYISILCIKLKPSCSTGSKMILLVVAVLFLSLLRLFTCVGYVTNHRFRRTTKTFCTGMSTGNVKIQRAILNLIQRCFIFRTERPICKYMYRTQPFQLQECLLKQWLCK